MNLKGKQKMIQKRMKDGILMRNLKVIQILKLKMIQNLKVKHRMSQKDKYRQIQDFIEICNILIHNCQGPENIRSTRCTKYVPF